MSIQLESYSKLMYYPTHELEVYRILSVIGRIGLDVQKRASVMKLLGEDEYKALESRCKLEQGVLGSITLSAETLFNYFLDKGDIKTLKDNFSLTFGFSSQQTFSILDPFAGKGEWLDAFKTFLPPMDSAAANLHLIANELEENRFLDCKNNENINESYNSSFEDLDSVPENSISLLLFNPPYGETNKTRNVRHYLEMIIERDLLFKSNAKNTWDRKNGKIVMVIRKDDLINIADLLAQHFEIDLDFIYKTHSEEYSKYKQFVLFATILEESHDIKNNYTSLTVQKLTNDIIDIANSEPEFPKIRSKIQGKLHFEVTHVPYKEIRNNYNILKESTFHKSDTKNSNWKWIKELTSNTKLDEMKINKPTPPKMGEVANIIASGMINGEMETEYGTHIVAGGTKSLQKQEQFIELDKEGEEVYKTKTLLYSEPYLNVLINKNGKTIIKELVGEGEIG